ncbi:MAG: heme NO-binding domain-containing protein [Pseudomonadota bacterium]
MHGLVNKSIQCFVRDTYGPEVWGKVAVCANVEHEGFEPMLTYEDQVTHDLLHAAQTALHKPMDVLLEDLGTYLVSHENVERLRRLLRFGGASFTDFLHSLEDLPERAKLAVPELDLPAMELRSLGDGQFKLVCSAEQSGFAHVMVGLLRTLADDYGALALLEYAGGADGREEVDIHVLDSGFSSGRTFSLAGEVEA